MHQNFFLSILSRQMVGLWLAFVSCFSLPLSAGEPGKMTREVWLECSSQLDFSAVMQTFKASPRYYQAPTSVTTFTGSSAPSEIADNFFSRCRAILTAPVTGDYTFWISSDDEGELFLSQTESKFGRVKIASCASWEGWTFDFFPTQKSVLIPLVAGQRYLIEALHYEGAYGDNMNIAWQPPGGTRTLIPPSALESFTVDPNDFDNDELSDTWEIAHGFSTTDNGILIPSQAPLEDPDKDGRNNLIESSLNLSPLIGNALPGQLTAERWDSIYKYTVADLTKADPYFGPPAQRDLLPNSSYQYYGGGLNFGARIRGTLIAPITGPYRFWVSSSNGGELWLGQNASKFSKRRIAAMGSDLGTGYGTSIGQSGFWDQYLCQMSVVVNLTAGQSYFFEMLTQQGYFSGLWAPHISSAWAPPGQDRVAIPASAFSSFAMESTDADDDYLPDAWESQYGLNPTNNGITARDRQGENGDFDSDGLNNLTEYQLGTNPANADTDGDGISDAYEVNGLNTNPLVANPPVSTLLSTIALGSFVSSSTPWTMTSGGLVPNDFRGDVTWNFSVPSAGHWLLQLESEIMGTTYSNEMVPVVIKVDGKTILRRKMNFGTSKFAILEALTQSLTPGQHQVTVMVDNMFARRSLRLVSLKVFSTTTANARKILAETERVTPIPATSRTSPAFIEGFSRDVAATTVNLNAVTLGTGNGHWFTNLPLDINAHSTGYQILLGAGGDATGQIQWQTTNAISAETLTIRQGDSLRVGVWNSNAPKPSTLTLSSGGTWNLEANASGGSRASVAISFPNPGTFTVTGTLQSGVSGVLTVKVIAPPTFSATTQDLLAGTIRYYEYPCDPAVVFDTPDDLCRTLSYRLDATTTTLSHYASFADELGLAARLFAGGPILAVQRLNVIGVSDAMQNDLTTTGTSSVPGYKLLSTPLTVVNLPPGARIEVGIFRAGVMFPNGSTQRTVVASDLVNGSIILEFLFPLGEAGGYCHTLMIYDRLGAYIGHR